MERVVTFEGPKEVGIREYEDRDLGPREVRLRTLYSGISAGTEMTAYSGSNPYLTKRWEPERRLFVEGETTLEYPVEGWGYEEVGEVSEIGTDVTAVGSGEVVYGTWGHRSTTVVDEDWAAARVLRSGIDPLVGVYSRPRWRQAVGELVYDVAQTQVAEQGLPHKAIGRWFPYVASLMLFIWVINLLGFIPLPLSNETFEIFGVELPTLAVYAATSSISVTLALALMTFVFTHVEGVRANGAVGYFKSWIPEVPKAMYPLIVPLEILGQFMRLISLSVRLYANMLAGHMLILTFIGLIFVIGNLGIALLAIPAAATFYLFEVVIVVSIQAFIFAALSAIYIGSAIEPEQH